jgi:hypothetical protein
MERFTKIPCKIDSSNPAIKTRFGGFFVANERLLWVVSRAHDNSQLKRRFKQPS